MFDRIEDILKAAANVDERFYEFIDEYLEIYCDRINHDWEELPLEDWIFLENNPDWKEYLEGEFFLGEEKEKRNIIYRKYHNALLAIEDGCFIVEDLIRGFGRTWKIKIDKHCGYVYSVQETQVKTMEESMEKLLDTIMEFMSMEAIAEKVGFRICYDY